MVRKRRTQEPKLDLSIQPLGIGIGRQLPPEIVGLGAGLDRPLAPTMASLESEDPRFKPRGRGIRRRRR